MGVSDHDFVLKSIIGSHAQSSRGKESIHDLFVAPKVCYCT